MKSTKDELVSELPFVHDDLRRYLEQNDPTAIMFYDKINELVNAVNECLKQVKQLNGSALRKIIAKVRC